MNTVPTKGHHIRFVKGTYAGRNGWIDSSRKKGKSNYRHVIVAADPEDQDSQEKCTHVKITSFAIHIQFHPPMKKQRCSSTLTLR
jgi:hypothetical protein